MDNELIQTGGVQFQGWTQKHHSELNTEEEAAETGFYTMRTAYRAYPNLCTSGQPAKGYCGHRKGEEWNLIVPGTERVQEMLQHVGALRETNETITKLAFQAEWPDIPGNGNLTELEDDLEHDTFKDLTNCRHPCIFEEGITWDLKRVGTYPCMHHIKNDGIKVRRNTVLRDAGNAIYASFMEKDLWHNITGYTFGEERKGVLVEFLCSPGRSRRTSRKPWRMRAPTMSKVCTRF